MAKRYEFFAVFACVLDAFIQKKMQKAKGEEPAKIGVDYEPKRHLPRKRYEKTPFLRGLVLKTGRWGALGVRAHDAATHQPVGTGVLDCPLFRTPLYNSLADPCEIPKYYRILLAKTSNSLHVLARSASQRATGTFATLRMTQGDGRGQGKKSLLW